jgi:hypothetical protein
MTILNKSPPDFKQSKEVILMFIHALLLAYPNHLFSTGLVLKMGESITLTFPRMNKTN